MRRWSKLQKELYNIMDSSVKFQMHCSIYKTRSSWVTKDGKGREMIPRYWITVGDDKKILWDFPNKFMDEIGLVRSYQTYLDEYPWTDGETYYSRDNYKWVSDLIREYINTPRDKMQTKDFGRDFGLSNIFRAYDRRIGKEARNIYIGKIIKK